MPSRGHSSPTQALQDAATAAFAAELRAMRERAGSPTFRHLARQAHFSASTLAEATAGRRLPSDQVVRALAAACGENPDQWSAKLAEAARPLSAEQATDPVQPQPPAAEDSVPHRPGSFRLSNRPRWLAAAALGLFVAGGVGGYALAGTDSTPTPARQGSLQQQPTSAASASASASVSYPADDGADPVAAHCAADAQLIDKAAIEKSGVQIGALELKFSSRCDAGWARVYLYPEGVADGLSGSLATVAVTAADGTSSGFSFRLQAQQPAYTDVILPHGGCLRATVTLTASARSLPPMTAAIPCAALPVAPSK